jgi:hypothetical protein
MLNSENANLGKMVIFCVFFVDFGVFGNWVCTVFLEFQEKKQTFIGFMRTKNW